MEQRPFREVKGQPRSQVVFFSNLPREDEKKKELLTVARRFGTVEKHLFLTDQVWGASRLWMSWLRRVTADGFPPSLLTGLCSAGLPC